MSKRKITFDCFHEKSYQEVSSPSLDDDRGLFQPETQEKETKIVTMSKNHLNSLINQVITQISKNNQHVSIYSVISTILADLRIESLDQIVTENGEKINKNGSNSESIQKLIDLHIQIDIFIHTSMSCSIISTISDIETSLTSEFNVTCFADLNIGPISKIPLIIKYFTLQKNLEKRFTLTTRTVLQNLMKYSQTHITRVNDIFGFLEYLCKTHKLSSFSELGIVIKDYISLVEIVKNANLREKDHLEEEAANLSFDIKNTLKNECDRLKTGTKKVYLNHLSPLVKAVSSVSISSLLSAFTEYITRKETSMNKHISYNPTEYQTVRDFIKILHNLVNHPKVDNNMIQLCLINSFFASLKSSSSITLHNMLIEEGYLSIDFTISSSSATSQTELISQLDSILSSNNKIEIMDLIRLEKEHDLVKKGSSILQQIESHKTLSSRLNIFTTKIVPKQSFIPSDVSTIIHQFSGSVPLKWAHLHLCRLFNTTNLTDLNIDNFTTFYTETLSTQPRKSICLETFLCGYPELLTNPFYDINNHLFADILEQLPDSSNVSTILMLNLHSFAKHICSDSSKHVAFCKSHLYIHDSSNQIYNISRFQDPYISLLKSVSVLDSTTSSSIIISELFSQIRHWDSPIYCLLSNWMHSAWKTITNLNHQDIYFFIINILIDLEDRLAAIIANRIIFPSLVKTSFEGNLYQMLWKVGGDMKIQRKLLSIAMYENIKHFLTPQHFQDYLSSIVVHRNNQMVPKNFQQTSKITLVSTVANDIKMVSNTQHVTALDPVVVGDCSLVSDCVELIESIRRDQYFMGVTVEDEKLKKSINSQIDRLTRTLRHLTGDLYSDKLHFLREILQNADDAFVDTPFYDEPTVAWIIDDSALVVLSNESGFTSSDILSLCDIGNSSKKNDSSHIGYKGIGFKSVFQVSDAPEIHSNNFHICFNYAKHGPLGYVMPDCIDFDINQHNRYINYVTPYCSCDWKTVLVLPYKITINVDALVSDIFNAIHDDLIIFLKHVKRFIILDAINNKSKDIRKQSNGTNMSIHIDDRMSNLIVINETIHPFPDKPDSTELSLAFRLPLDNNIVSTYTPPREPLYCYLPVDGPVFRFIVNSRFELTSSRESILVGSVLNISILQHVPNILFQLIDHLKQRYIDNHVDWFYVFLSYLPSSLDLYPPPLDILANNIISTLRNYSMIYCADNNIYSPCQVMILPNEYIDFFDSNSQYHICSIEQFTRISQIGVFFQSKHNKFTQHTKHALLSLGVRFFDIHILSEFISKWFNSDERESMLQPHLIGVIFAVLAKLIYKHPHVTYLPAIRIISSLSIIPSNNTFHDLSEPVFYSTLELDYSIISSSYRFINESTLSICKTLSDEYMTKILLKSLDIREYNHFEMLEPFLKQYYSSTLSLKYQLQIVKYLSNIYKINSNQMNLENISELINLTTSTNEIISAVMPIYNPTKELKLLTSKFKSTDWKFIHPAYLEDSAVVEFLYKFSLYNSIQPYKIKTDSSLYRNMISSLKLSTLLNLQDITTRFSYDLTNFNILDILINGDTLEKTELSMFLDQNWDTFHCISNSEYSSLCILMQNHVWIPSMLSTYDIYRPCRLFNKTQQNISFLGPNNENMIANYEFKNSQLCTLIRIKTQLSSKYLQIILKNWSLNDFITDSQHIFSIYKYIREHCLEKDSTFIGVSRQNQIPLIFMPNRDNVVRCDKNECVSGKFVFQYDLFISDPIFNGLYLKFPPLSNVYQHPDLIDIFLTFFKIPIEPTFDSYIFMFSTQFIPSLSNDSTPELISVASHLGLRCLDSNDVVSNLMNDKFCTNLDEIYNKIRNCILPDHSTRLYNTVKLIHCIPTEKGEMIAPSSKSIVICNDFSLREYLSKTNEFQFVALDSNQFNGSFINITNELIGMIAFCCACKIQLISSMAMIHVESPSSTCTSRSDLYSLLQQSLPYIYAYIHTKYPVYSEKLLAKNVWNKITKLKIYEAKTSFNVVVLIDSHKIRHNVNIFGFIDKVNMVLHMIATEINHDVLYNDIGRMIFDEFLKIVVGSCPPLIREISCFAREIMMCSGSSDMLFLNKCGLNKSLFRSFMNQFVQTHEKLITNFGKTTNHDLKVKYNTILGTSCSKTYIQPVSHPSYQETVEVSDTNKTDNSSGDLENISINMKSSSAYTDSIGRWGEAVVNQILRTNNTLRDSIDPITNVHWVNETSESFLPYDFMVKTSNGKSERTIYIEVKASSNPTSYNFDVSINELEFAIQKQGNYHLYKVVPKSYKLEPNTALHDDVSLTIYQNLAYHFKKKLLRLVAVSR